MYEVTIAMPLYNAGHYLVETMESALNQTFKSIEYLIIDDRGTDQSIDYMCQLQNTHQRGKDIRIVTHEKNMGVSAARNTILKEVRSKYLFFLDSDDLITSDCIEVLYNAAEQNKAEIVYGSYKEVWSNNQKKESIFISPSQLFNGENKLAEYAFEDIRRDLRSFVWNNLYNTSFLKENRLQFEAVKVWEDLLFSYDMIPLVKSAVFIPNVTYIYIKREGSLSQYNSRNTIPHNEIAQHIKIRTLCRNKCLKNLGKPYFEGMITKVVIICYKTAAVILNKRKQITPPITSKELTQLTKYPLTLGQVFKFKNHKTTNVILYLIGNLPYFLLKTLFLTYDSLLKYYRNKKK